MKKNVFLVVAAVLAMTLVSCGGPMGTAQSTTAQPQAGMSGNGVAGLLGGQQNGSQGLLGSLLGSLVSQAIPMTAESLTGTWTYTSPECRFESENFLAQAGGEVAASTVESKMADYLGKVGIRQGSCQFAFSNGNICVITIGGRQIQGTYTVNSSTREFVFTSQTGLLSLSATAYLGINELTLLFDANKMLTFVQGLGALSGNGATASTISSLLTSYKGMKLGVNLKK